MSTFVLPQSRARALLQALHEAGFRAPTAVDALPRTPTTVTYTPDLTPDEQATFDLVSQLAVGAAIITAAEYETIRPHLTTIRDLRQMGRSAFMALTAAERDRLMYDAHAATTTILLALLRD
jgi:hypothetical protein